jgi:hypothetical protein
MEDEMDESSGDEKRKIQKYDMRTDVWTNFLEIPTGVKVAPFGEDLYMFGYDEAAVVKLSLASGTISPTALPMPTIWQAMWQAGAPDDGHVDLVESDGCIYLFDTQRKASGEYFTSCFMLRPEVGTWIPRPNPPRGLYCSSFLKRNGDILVLGGSPDDSSWSSASVWRFGKRTRNSTREWTGLPSMSRARVDHGAVLVENSIYVFGGSGSPGDGDDSAEAFDLAKGVWTPLPGLPCKVSWCSAVLLSGADA